MQQGIPMVQAVPVAQAQAVPMAAPPQGGYQAPQHSGGMSPAKKKALIVCAIVTFVIIAIPFWVLQSRGCMCPNGYERYDHTTNSNSCDCEGDMFSCEWRCPVPGNYNQTICFKGNEQLSSCTDQGGERGMAGGGRVFCPGRSDYCDCTTGGCRNDVNLCGCTEADSCCGRSGR